MTDRLAPRALLLVGVAVGSVQFGAALARTLFDEAGPAGTVLVRVGLAAIVLAVIWRPAIRGHSRSDWRLAIAFGVSLAVMNLTFYESIARIPLGLAVTFEFIGPLGVALSGSRRRLDVLWLSSAIPYSAEFEALRLMPEHVFGVLLSLEPAVAALAGYLVLDQALGAGALAGIAFVTAATAGAVAGTQAPAPRDA